MLLHYWKVYEIFIFNSLWIWHQLAGVLHLWYIFVVDLRFLITWWVIFSLLLYFLDILQPSFHYSYLVNVCSPQLWRCTTDCLRVLIFSSVWRFMVFLVIFLFNGQSVALKITYHRNMTFRPWTVAFGYSAEWIWKTICVVITDLLFSLHGLIMNAQCPPIKAMTQTITGKKHAIRIYQ